MGTATLTIYAPTFAVTVSHDHTMPGNFYRYSENLVLV